MGNYLMKIVYIAALLILFFFFIRFLEKKSLYFPLRSIEASPKDIGLNYEDVIISTKDDVRLSAWFIPTESPRAVIIFFHGNGGNISHRLDKIKILNKLALDVFIFDYRGYGLSNGSPSENGLYLDAEAVYDYLINEKETPLQKIIGYGESLGGAVVIDLASKHNMGGMIIEGCFTSVRDMAKKVIPFIPAFILKSKFDSLGKIKDVMFPKLFFHSISDEIVPFEQGKRLYENAPEPKELVQLQGGHNDSFLVSQDVFASKIDSFISSIEKK
jgi:fermentation-respiration switch protein FrsA (DUF1100 family)